MYNIDFQVPSSPDPLKRGLHPSCTFRVMGIDAAVSTRDIHGALKVENGEPRHTYEVIWVDDSTFMVAVKATNVWIPLDFQLKSPADDTHTDGIVQDSDVSSDAMLLQQHCDMARTVKQALQRRFGDENIVAMDEYWEQHGMSPSGMGTAAASSASSSGQNIVVGNNSKRKRGFYNSVVMSIVDYMPFKKRRRTEEE
jgi:hypothetical protein